MGKKLVVIIALALLSIGATVARPLLSLERETVWQKLCAGEVLVSPVLDDNGQVWVTCKKLP